MAAQEGKVNVHAVARNLRAGAPGWVRPLLGMPSGGKTQALPAPAAMRGLPAEGPGSAVQQVPRGARLRHVGLGNVLPHKLQHLLLCLC